MSDIAKTIPEQVIEASKAFTQTLEMENAVLQNQLDGIIKTTISAFQQLIVLCKESIAVGNSTIDATSSQALTGVIQKALADAQQATTKAVGTAVPALPETAHEIPPGQELDSVLVQAVGQSYENAVTAQQQASITQQAATTMIISTILSMATDTLGVAVREAESGKASG